MGGAIHMPTPGGNITPNAEFNFYCDPYAASVVLQSGLPITVVPLDVTECCRLRHSVYEQQLMPLADHAPLPSFVTSFLKHLYGHMFRLDEDLSGGIRTLMASDSVHSLSDVSNEVSTAGGGASSVTHIYVCLISF